MAKGKTEGENGKPLKTTFCLNRFTSHRATKLEVVRNYIFIQIFSVRRYVQYSIKNNDSKWFNSESFVSLFIWNNHQPKFIWQLPQTQPANFACNWHLKTTKNTLIYQDMFYLNPCSNRCLQLSQSGRVKNVFLAWKERRFSHWSLKFISM